MAKNAIILGVGLADNVSKQLDTMASKLRGKMRNLASVGSELTMGITLPIVAAGGATLKFAADLDSLKKALAATMGSASGAETEFLKLKEAAKAPGIGLEEAIKGSFILQGLGASADEARRQMLALAKAVALSGGGEAQFGGVMQQFTQMKGVGKILGGDIRFMIENAPILAKVLNDAFGTANPERIRDMGVSVDTLIEKMITGLEGMSGIAGSVKNDLENIWTSIRIGVGEIGLAALSATGWGDDMSVLSDKITEITSRIRDWIKEHPKLTKNILTTLAAMAGTGPFIRFIADMGLAASTVALFSTKLYSLLAIVGSSAFTYFSTGGWMKASALGWAGIALAINEALQKLRDWETEWINSKFANEGATPGNRIAAFASGFWDIWGLQFGKGMDKMRKAFGDYEGEVSAFSRRTGFEGLGSVGHFGGKSFGVKKPPPPPPPPGDEPKPQELVPMSEWLKRQSTPDDKPNPAEGMGKGKFMSGPVGGVPFGIDTEFLDKIRTAKDITKEFDEAIKDAGISQKLGATETEAMGIKVDALAEKYRGMVDVYGEGSSRATSALAEFISMNDTYLQKLKEIKAEEEKKNMAVEYGMTLMGGVAETFADGIKGAQGFGRAILKAAGAMIKLAISTYVQKTIQTLGFAGAIPAIIGGGALIGAIDGLLGKVSLAKGGVLTGESMVRAGEYPGVATNPEIIAPASVMQKYIKQAISETGGGGGYSVIRGKDIHIVAGMHERISTRIGGPSIVG